MHATKPCKANKIHEFFKEKSRDLGSLVLDVGLLYTNCFKALLEGKTESWNSRIALAWWLCFTSIPSEIQLEIKEESWNAAILLLQVALSYIISF